MQIKKLAAISLAVTLAAVPTFTFAANSKDYHSSGTVSTVTSIQLGNGTSGTSQPKTEVSVHVATDGTMISTTGSTLDLSNTTMSLVVGAVTEKGVISKTNEKGGIWVDTVSVHFATGIAETAGLPTDIVAQIDALNQGKAVSQVLGNSTGVELVSYRPVGSTRAVIATDSVTGLTKTAAEIVIRVDAVDSADMAAVYYDNNTGRWVFVPVIVDLVNKLVRITVPGSCTLQLLEKITF